MITCQLVKLTLQCGLGTPQDGKYWVKQSSKTQFNITADTKYMKNSLKAVPVYFWWAGIPGGMRNLSREDLGWKGPFIVWFDFLGWSRLPISYAFDQFLFQLLFAEMK